MRRRWKDVHLPVTPGGVGGMMRFGSFHPTTRAAVGALYLLLTTVPAAAQDAPAAYAQSGYDTDGQSVDSIAVFFEPLSHYGRWLDTRFGRAWLPNVPPGWRPYTVGHWEEGRYGTTWRSEEPFGWAVFHFGRWAFDDRLGWVWLPDTVWGPGWVAWRDGDDVAGWAPLPPAVGSFALGSGYGVTDWGYDQWYAPAWVYVPRGALYGRSLRGAFLSPARNRDLWERTRGVNRDERIDGQQGDRRDHRAEGTRDLRRDGTAGGFPRDGTAGGFPRDGVAGGFPHNGVVPPFGRGPRDGFVPGAPPPRSPGGRGSPSAGLPALHPLPSAPAPGHPAMPAPRPVMPALRPAPGPAPHGRDPGHPG